MPSGNLVLRQRLLHQMDARTPDFSDLGVWTTRGLALWIDSFYVAIDLAVLSRLPVEFKRQPRPICSAIPKVSS